MMKSSTMNTFKRIYEDETPFSRSTGTCNLIDGNIVCKRTGEIVVVGVVMTPELEDALYRIGAKNGEIHIKVQSESGRIFPAVIRTLTEW